MRVTDGTIGFTYRAVTLRRDELLFKRVDAKPAGSKIKDLPVSAHQRILHNVSLSVVTGVDNTYQVALAA